MHKSDNLFASPMSQVSDFQFDEQVADVFPDMIQRSVPGYQTILHTIGELAKSYITDGSRAYDLGCSLGAASLAMARNSEHVDCEIIGIDNSEPMIERCARKVKSFHLPNPVTLHCESILESTISHASMVVMNFTLQFLPPNNRLAMLKKIYDGLNPGGILLLSEKIQHPSEQGNRLLVDLHHQFKRNNGYSELEVSQKRAALENVMLTDTFATHESRLREVGFADVVMWFKCYNFSSIIAVKTADTQE
ncbi:carboxy-S-adenosyl-L-methionine synthase CmoA [Aestuariibacter sp. A3R04]|uniref:carboxy-S-adenosyl-L-methionine synthase CmoA n=1 Tax=Aestuariibacter sp. A3R04 TaxID=2841571 RepID=UPI001C08CD09|nr:carboxy-S-adenosyl-L-methionine synthase CmoA [Aestuariibacter sp. A3R04]MBU3022785.1 carboxy-S-adenosyl-L-methionine synthase CmoA [Aestuariibacter sp. A3R04]